MTTAINVNKRSLCGNSVHSMEAQHINQPHTHTLTFRHVHTFLYAEIIIRRYTHLQCTHFV